MGACQQLTAVGGGHLNEQAQPAWTARLLRWKSVVRTEHVGQFHPGSVGCSGVPEGVPRSDSMAIFLPSAVSPFGSSANVSVKAQMSSARKSNEKEWEEGTC